jgi:hypothetical protein
MVGDPRPPGNALRSTVVNGLYSRDTASRVRRRGGQSPSTIAVTSPLPEPFAIVVALRPLSSNRGGPTSRYTAAIQRAAQAQGARILTGPLYARITWFLLVRAQGDIDNIAKLILDSLKGVLIQDDDDIVRCLIQKTVADEHGIYDYDSRSIASALTRAELQLLLLAEQHVLYIEVGRVTNPIVSFGPVI